MDNGMDALSSLLSDPAALSAAMEMAKGLLAGQGQGQGAAESAEPVSQEPVKPPPAVNTADDDKTRLLLALKPFLSPKRSEKVGTVIALMRAMQMMGTILPHEGGK